MDPLVLQRLWGDHEAAAAATTIASMPLPPPLPTMEPAAFIEAASAAGYFPLPPPHQNHHPHAHLYEDVGFELFMTGVASLVVIGMWVGGLVLWYVYCIRRPPRLFLGTHDVGLALMTRFMSV